MELGLRPVDFQRSDQSRGQPDREIDQPSGPHDRRVDADQPSPRILQGEVRLADRQQHVIPRGLHIRLARGDDSLCGKWLVNRVGDRDVQAGTAAHKERLSILLKQAPP